MEGSEKELERIGGDDTEQGTTQTFRLFPGVLASENGKKYSGRPMIFTRILIDDSERKISGNFLWEKRIAIPKKLRKADDLYRMQFCAWNKSRRISTQRMGSNLWLRTVTRFLVLLLKQN